MSSILFSDLFLVVDGGCPVERGTHTELLAQDGTYARLYRTQFRAQAGELESGTSPVVREA